ncbi:MAG: DNRLRE domain-containing protein, partial [Acidobacteria bacterium]
MRIPSRLLIGGLSAPGGRLGVGWGLLSLLLILTAPAPGLPGSAQDGNVVAIGDRLEGYRGRVVAQEGKVVVNAWVRSGAYHFEFDDGTFGLVLPVNRDPQESVSVPSPRAPGVVIGAPSAGDGIEAGEDLEAADDRAASRSGAAPAPQATSYIDATADTHVYSAMPSSALGSMQYLLVGTYSGTSFAFMRATPFSVAGTITESQLWAYAESCAGTVPSNASISAHRISGSPDWGESTTTWENYPAFQSVAEDTMPTSGCPSGWRAWDITSAARGWNDGSYSNRGIALRYPSGSPSGSAVSFTSTEGSSTHSPYFYVAYSATTSCSYSFSPSQANVGASAGSGSVTVTGSPSGCQGSWTATEGSFWLAISGSTS